MDIKMVNIGYGNFVSGERIIVVVSPESAPVKRIIGEAKEERRLIDATCGKKTRAVIITDSDHVILSALTTERIMKRSASEEDSGTDNEENGDDESK